jgi:hypothetical protein
MMRFGNEEVAVGNVCAWVRTKVRSATDEEVPSGRKRRSDARKEWWSSPGHDEDSAPAMFSFKEAMVEGERSTAELIVPSARLGGGSRGG